MIFVKWQCNVIYRFLKDDFCYLLFEIHRNWFLVIYGDWKIKKCLNIEASPPNHVGHI